MGIKLFCALTLTLLTVTGCNERENEKPITSPELIRDIDKIRLSDLNGKAISLKQYKDKTIFINFWATWCKPCIQEMPSIKGAQDRLQNKGIIFLLASDEDVEQIEEFKKAHDYPFNYVRIENSEEMNVRALPTTFIFNSNGEKVFGETGTRQWNNKNNIDTIIKIANK